MIAAVVPIDVPTTNLVNGIIATSKIINGTERKKFTIGFKMEKIILLSKICPLRVTTKVMPIKIPNTLPKKSAILTMYNVSQTALRIISDPTSICHNRSEERRVGKERNYRRKE